MVDLLLKPVAFKILLCIVFSRPAFSQTLHAGFEGGYQVNRLLINTIPRPEGGFTSGYTAGVSLRYLNQNRQGMKIGLMWMQRGYQQTAPTPYDLYVDYLEIPLHTYITIGKKYPYLVLYGGPFASVEISNSFEGPEPFDFRRNQFQAGVSGGLGVYFGAKGQEFGFHVLYANHLTNLYFQQDLNPLAQSFLQGININLQYFFSLRDWSAP